MDLEKYDDHCLPDVVLLRMFGKLGIEDLVNVTKVCVRYRHLAQKCTKLWKKVKLSGYIDLANGELDYIFSFPIGELDLNEICVTENVPAFVSGSEVADPNFYLPLRKLSFGQLEWLDSRIKVEILDKCRPVELVLDQTVVTIQMLKAVCKNQNLKVLSMKYSRYKLATRPTEIQSVTDIQLPDTLEKLMLNHASEWFTCDERMSVALLKNCTNLKHLGISASSLTRKVFKIVAKLELLESLWFCQCDWQWVRFELSRILTKLPWIKAVHIFKQYDNANYKFERVKDEFPKLQTELAENGIGMTVEQSESEFKFLFHKNTVNGL